MGLTHLLTTVRMILIGIPKVQILRDMGGRDVTAQGAPLAQLISWAADSIYQVFPMVRCVSKKGREGNQKGLCMVAPLSTSTDCKIEKLQIKDTHAWMSPPFWLHNLLTLLCFLQTLPSPHSQLNIYLVLKGILGWNVWPLLIIPVVCQLGQADS